MRRLFYLLAGASLVLLLSSCMSSPPEKSRTIQPTDSIVVGYVEPYTLTVLGGVDFKQLSPPPMDGKDSWGLGTDDKYRGYFWATLPPGKYRLSRLYFVRAFDRLHLAMQVNIPDDQPSPIEVELPDHRTLVFLGAFKVVPQLGSVRIEHSDKLTEQAVWSWLANNKNAAEVKQDVMQRLNQLGGPIPVEGD